MSLPNNPPITQLSGVGKRTAERLEKLHIYRVQDLLFHLPSRYQDRSRLNDIKQIQAGQEIQIDAQIIHSSRQPRSLICTLGQQHSNRRISLRLFHYNPSQASQLQQGAYLRCFGEVRQGRHGLELIHPEYQLIDPKKPPPLSQQLIPIYPSTEGLNQKTWQKLISQAFQYPLEDLLAAYSQQLNGLPDLISAIRYLHHPPLDIDHSQISAGTHPVQQRLALEELLAHQLSLALLKQQSQQQQAPSFNNKGHYQQKLLKQLSFKLTAAQQRVSQEISHDLKQQRPMQRLLQGDVGSGKTIIAALAAFQALESNYQVAIMAPTELLAEQHRRNFTGWLTCLDIQPTWLVGSLTAKQKRETLNAIATGENRLIIGTHALFQDKVQFQQLGLIIVDEQHRFGVHQRLALRDKAQHNNQRPHQLIMTATPIPRTLAMISYADLDISIIDELPPGRKAITTVVMPEHKRENIIERIAEVGAEGRQSYWVCPLIEESETLASQAATETASYLQERLPHLRIGLVHGKLKAKQKDQIMQAFKAHELDLLVATTVIEVGVDVPNASLMIIENAERMGMAQLHQLRGRVGRGNIDSYCVLIYKAPLSAQSHSRLNTLRESQDGFYIAKQDLKLRGPGELLGTRQTGLMQLRIADLNRDKNLLPSVQQLSKQLLQHPSQAQALINRWLAPNLHYGDAY